MRHTPLEVGEATVAGQQTHDGLAFPLVLALETPDASLDDALAWLGSEAVSLVERASTHGAILFRGFPVATAEDFDRFVKAFGLPNFPYERSLSNAVRLVKTPRVFTANEAPASVAIYLHHEMAQTPLYPAQLFFFCEQPAQTGGATPLCRSDLVWRCLRDRAPAFARDCETKGLRYTHVMPAEPDPASGMGRSWRSTLGAADRASAESRLAALGYTWDWLDEDCLRVTTPVLPAVRPLPGGRTAFFNQLIAASSGWKDRRNDPSRAITFGDGAPLDPAGVAAAAALGEALSFDTPWQRGDVALVDNLVAMHGRRTFTGVRKVLASLTAGAAGSL